MSTYVKEGNIVTSSFTPRRSCEFTESIFSLAALESQLVSYISDSDSLAKPFDTSSIPKVSKEQAAKESAREYQHTTISLCMLTRTQAPAAWRLSVFLQHQRLLLLHLRRLLKHNRHMRSSWQTYPSSQSMVRCSTAVQNLPSSRRRKRNTKCHVSSTSSRNTLSSRFVYTSFPRLWSRLIWSSVVQCGEYNPGHSSGTDVGCDATTGRLWTHGRLYHPIANTITTNVLRHCVRLVLARQPRGLHFGILPMCPQVRQQGGGPVNR